MCHNGQDACSTSNKGVFGGQVVGRALTLRSASTVCVSVLVVRVERCCELSGPATKMRLCVCRLDSQNVRTSSSTSACLCLVTSQCVNFLLCRKQKGKQKKLNRTEQIFTTKGGHRAGAKRGLNAALFCGLPVLLLTSSLCVRDQTSIGSHAVLRTPTNEKANWNQRSEVAFFVQKGCQTEISPVARGPNNRAPPVPTAAKQGHTSDAQQRNKVKNTAPTLVVSRCAGASGITVGHTCNASVTQQ
jgi:hypothetical protein